MPPRSTMSYGGHVAGPSPLSSAVTANEIPSHRPSGEPIPISEQLMQVDQAITLTLQEIDANFAKCHQTITGKILPSIRRYGVASHNTWQGARFWHRFFETASDINLVPSYESEERPPEDTSSASRFDLVDNNGEGSASPVSSSPIKPRREGHHDEKAAAATMESEAGASFVDDSGEFDERDLEPPRLSEASRAATERFRSGTDAVSAAVTTWATVESPFEKLKKDVENDFQQWQEDAIAAPMASTSTGKYTADRSMAPEAANERYSAQENKGSAAQTPRKNIGSNSKLATQVLRNQHEQSSRSTRKVQATPRHGSTNPFVPGKEVQSSVRRDMASRWNGIADLRKTPLAKGSQEGGIKRKGALANDQGNESVDSLAWPADLSPPITMKFTLPQRKYDKTPAKSAARLVVDDLLRTIEGNSPASRRSLQASTQKNPGGRINSSSRPVGPGKLTSTPLKRALQKGRLSFSSPSSASKKVPETTKPSPRDMSSARLLDDGEGGSSIDEVKIPTELEVGLSRLTLTQGLADIDRLLALDGEDDDDSSGEDDGDSDSEDEELVPPAGRTSRIPVPHSNTSDYPTGSSLVSNSRSIDQDTLFGIRDPQRPSSRHSQLPSGDNSNSSDGPIPSANARTDKSGNRESYQPMGARLYDEGTIYGGRPLLGDDREDTFSAPSPTPAATMARSNK